MSFEIKEKDLLARIGRLQTKSGKIETPLFFPVINPAIQLVSPRKIKEDLGFEALITNAYILKQRFQDQPVQQGIHKFLDYNGAVMTDSGAYQILVYGDVQATPLEIIRYQEQIHTDIATILDVPTGWKTNEESAKDTVKETLKRAKQLFKQKTRNDILWVGPVQGGRYLNLLAKSAKETAKLPFQIHALGSPTEVMERYRFDVLVEMIMTAKMNLPLDRPLHLFGAGHPFMLALAVALGCDLFDSAAYALYAREGRYMTENGTHRLEELDYFPCNCPKCSQETPKQMREHSKNDKEIFLAEHNLYVCAAELKRIKQAIKDGRLWEHLKIRAHSHPSLFQALKKLAKYERFIEKHNPITKRSGLFFCDSKSLVRPEVVRHKLNMATRYTKPQQTRSLLLIPQPQTKPFHKSTECKQIVKNLLHKNETHVCFYAAPFGIVPIELDECYPLSQYENATPFDKETAQYVAKQVGDYINRTAYKEVILVNDAENWGKTIYNTVRRTCQQKGVAFKTPKSHSDKSTIDKKQNHF